FAVVGLAEVRDAAWPVVRLDEVIHGLPAQRVLLWEVRQVRGDALVTVLRKNWVGGVALDGRATALAVGERPGSGFASRREVGPQRPADRRERGGTPRDLARQEGLEIALTKPETGQRKQRQRRRGERTPVRRLDPLEHLAVGST